MAFKHQPFDDPGKEIRLLKVTQAPNSKSRRRRIRCILVHYAIEEAPPYVGISYTWGRSELLKTINVNGCDLKVRLNCWYVLRQAQIHGVTDPLWLDALCIDQANDEEKGVQVGMMGDIYHNAAGVHVCVGPHRDGSDLLVQKIREHAEVLALPAEQSEREDLYDYYYGNSTDEFAPWLEWQDSKALGWFQQLRQSDLSSLRHAYLAFIDRAYFYRLWIIQEIFCARRVTVFCGNSTINFRDLSEFSGDFERYVSWLAHGDAAAARSKDWQRFFEGRSPAKKIMSLSSLDDPWSLDEAKTSLSSSRCADPRDKIYALLRVLTWDELRPIQPDYTKAPWQIAREIVRTSYLDPCRFDFIHVSCVTNAAALTNWMCLNGKRPPFSDMLLGRRAALKTQLRKESSTQDRSPNHIVCIGDTVCLSDLDPCGLALKTYPEVSPDWHPHPIDIQQPLPEHVQIADSEGVHGVLSPLALPGDFLVIFQPHFWRVGLILRQESPSSNRLEIVGQAIFSVPLRLADESWRGESSDRPHTSGPGLISVHFDIDDLMLWVCQDNSGDSSLDPDAELLRHRLIAPVTASDDPFSSFGEFRLPRKAARMKRRAMRNASSLGEGASASRAN